MRGASIIFALRIAGVRVIPPSHQITKDKPGAMPMYSSVRLTLPAALKCHAKVRLAMVTTAPMLSSKPLERMVVGEK